ncbi:hypothetical protein CHLNCDRAFT_133293 [Chlorella variabilis]|uniref:Nonsense-mediated mRNA decay factor SMG8 n=1 Tax=Chlorella variabilis TaxID=554065 RepID=E1Z2T5_CHLVA|nr:hypothetical protein CHLNCDRAFT_133293 [Chlorella variabilis]EFN60052.1 hypothetical protein CHLNCDRAFT_133293 [Chlorella variabilis]|eukprot:XP_005852154.1 hypothetical protein CHLNCDRAFT_133293 [Chlorella variabilis]
MFVVGVVGDTLEGASAAVGRLAGCSLPHALVLPRQAALQPQGWLAERCVCYHDAASDTLWMGLAAAAVPQAAAGAVLSRDEAREHEADATRALLLLFLTSHAVLWVQPARALASTQLLSQLRLLQQLKSALLPALPALLGVAAAEATAAVPGLCVPQLLVLAQPPPASAPPRQHQGQPISTPAAPALSAEEAAHHPLAQLLKRCRVLYPDDGSARALCTLPAAAPMLLPLPEHLGSSSQEQLVAEALAELLAPPTQQRQQQQAGKPAATAAAAVAAALAPQQAAVAAVAGGGTQEEALVSWRQAVATLAAVLEAAAAPAPAGTASRPAAADVAVPAEAAAAAAWQSACSRVVWDFSHASCKRAAAVASDAYRRNTPALLPAAGHTVALQAALCLYRSLARGPAADAGAEALQQQLSAYWRDGHMQCDAVSFLGNPCCLPAHDSQQQAHASSSGGAGAAAPQLLLASGSGGQQHTIPEPFTVAELQRAAAAVASDCSAAAARAQFYVRRLAGPGALAADVAGQAALGRPGAAGGEHAGAAADMAAAAAGPAAAAAALEAEAEAEAIGRGRLSGDGHSSGEEEAGRTPGADGKGSGGAGGAARASAPAAGAPAAGCWLELHVLGPRSMYKSPALAAALLMDGQPGWLRAGGVMLASLPVQVAVPLKPGQQAARSAAQAAAAAEDEEFPSLQQVKQQQQQQQQQQQHRRPGGKKLRPKEAAAGGGGAAAAEGKAASEVQLPAVLSWPGLKPPAASARAPLFVAANKDGKPQPARPSKQRSGKLQAAVAAGAASPAATAAAAAGPAAAAAAAVAAGAAAAGPAAAAAAAVAAGAAGTEQVTVLLGVEYESVQGQRLLLTPALLAAALQSSLDEVSVRQQSPPAAAASQPRTAAAAAAGASTAPTAAAAFLLQQDLPLWLQLPADQLTRLAGSAKRRSAPGGPTAASGGERPVWLQLRRLLIGTPDVAVPLEADPKLQLEVPASMLAPVATPTSAAAGAGKAGGSVVTVQLQYSLAAPLPIPPASFCVLALPWLLTAPTTPPTGAAAAGPGSSGGPAALIRQSGPLRAVLLGRSAVRPKGLQLQPPS